MENLTITTAIKIGFDFENASFDSYEEMEKAIIEFLIENSDKLKRVNEACEVSGHGNHQMVTHGDFSVSGEILNYGVDYWKKKVGTRVYHSEYMRIEKTGLPVSVNLYQKVLKTHLN